MKKYAILNQKGGVGKTTTVANVAAALALRGKKVVVMDMDPQAHLTIHFGVDSDQHGGGTYGVLTQGADFRESLVAVRENLWLLGSNIDLVGAESELVSVVGREIILREAVEPYKNEFDYLMIDCPPSLGLLSLNALAAVGQILIPVQPHFLALQGFGKLLQTVSLVNQRINPSLRISAILLCMFDSRTSLSAEVKNDIDQFLRNAEDADLPWSGAAIVPVHVRRNIKLAEAPSHGKTIFEYEPACNGAVDYQKVADYLLRKDFPQEADSWPQNREQSEANEAPPSKEDMQSAQDNEPDAEQKPAGEDNVQDVKDFEQHPAPGIPIREIETTGQREQQHQQDARDAHRMEKESQPFGRE